MKPKTLEETCAALAAALMDCLELLGRARDEPQPATRLYTSDELMDTFHKSRGTISQWIQEGLFSDPVKVGNSIMVPQAGVDKFIADHSGPVKKQPSKARRRTSRTAAGSGSRSC